MPQDRVSYIYASGSRVIYIYASYMHASGSRVIYICIMDTYIYTSGSRIKIIYISIIIRVKDHRYMHRTYKHHTNIHQGQGSKIYASHTLSSRITDICITYTFIKNHRYMHHTYKHQTNIHQGQGSKICASHIVASRSRVYHRYMHH